MDRRTKLTLSAIAVAGIFLGSAALAQPWIADASAAPSLGNPLIGSGIVVPVGDASSFEPVDIVITARKNAEYRGLLRLPGERLQITSVSVLGNTTTGRLERNGTLVGSLSLAPSGEGKWNGEMTLDGQAYELFVFVPRGFFHGNHGLHAAGRSNALGHMGMMRW